MIRTNSSSYCSYLLSGKILQCSLVSSFDEHIKDSRPLSLRDRATRKRTLYYYQSCIAYSPIRTAAVVARAYNFTKIQLSSFAHQIQMSSRCSKFKHLVYTFIQKLETNEDAHTFKLSVRGKNEKHDYKVLYLGYLTEVTDCDLTSAFVQKEKH